MLQKLQSDGLGPKGVAVSQQSGVGGNENGLGTSRITYSGDKRLVCFYALN